LAVACASFHVAVADEPTAPVAVFRTDWGIQLGPITLTPGGFLEFTSIYRQRNETADIASTFSAIPLRNNNNYYIKEYRQTARDTRVSLLAQGPPGYNYMGEGYLETDFVSAGTSSNSNESNSYTLRVRQAYLSWSRPDLGWAIVAGQGPPGRHSSRERWPILRGVQLGAANAASPDQELLTHGGFRSVP
jgi:hypothetical protein